MSKLFAQTLLHLNDGDLYNGHNQIAVTHEVAESELLSLVEDIEIEMSESDKRIGTMLCSCGLRLYPEGGGYYGVVYLDDYWGKDEHRLGHTDKRLVTFEKVVQG